MMREARKIRAIIADSDPQVRDSVRAVTTDQPDMHVIAECVSSSEAIRAIQAYRPEIVFVSLDLPEGGARNVVERVGPDRMPATVFLTPSDSDAARGLDAHALDYLVTPIVGAAVQTVLASMRSRVMNGRAADRSSEKLADYIANAAAPPAGGTRSSQRIARFMIRERDRIRFIAAEDVDWIEGARNYVRLHVGERSHLLRGPLTAILEQLDPVMFARIHRSIIVNVERINEVQPWLGGDYVAILRSGERLRVSRNFRDAVVRKPVKA
ncbi:MAG: LytTR family DNA-binding domain-containing protein [Longimicrobiales bacterium]